MALTDSSLSATVSVLGVHNTSNLKWVIYHHYVNSMYLRSSIFCDSAWCRLYLATAILWQIIGPTFEGQTVHKACTACPLKTALLRCLKMFEIELPVLPTSRNIPEERWPQLHSGGSLKSRMLYNAILQTLDVPAIWVYHNTAGVGSSVRLLQSTDDEEKLAASIFDIVQERCL